MVGEDEQFLPDLDRELKSFIRGERNGNKNYYSELKVNKYYLIALFFFSVFFVLVYSIYTSFLYSKI